VVLFRDTDKYAMEVVKEIFAQKVVDELPGPGSGTCL
jgi:hypothetical protein